MTTSNSDPGAPARGDRWRGWENAERYNAFVRDHDVYAWLNAQLITTAQLEGRARVLDLGCGTGATTRAALGAVAVHGEVIGIDGSPEMVEVARASTIDPRATFLVSAAYDVARVVEGTFDAAVSNAAFWQFSDQPQVWRALGQLLAPGAPLAFNVPAERGDDIGPSHGFQVALARAIERRAGHLYLETATRFDLDQTQVHAVGAGFVEELREMRSWEGPQSELIELMRIPAMMGPIASGLSPDQVLEAVDEAAGRVSPDEQVQIDWIYLRYRRTS
jgi:trans-aconitate methyltransferase